MWQGEAHQQKLLKWGKVMHVEDFWANQMLYFWGCWERNLKISMNMLQIKISWVHVSEDTLPQVAKRIDA